MTGAQPPVATDSDLMLVERTVAGDQRAFELLVIKYQRKVGRLLSRFVPGRGHRPGNLYPGLPGPAPVPW